MAPSSCAHNGPVPDLDEQVRRVFTLLSVHGGGGEPYRPRLTRAATFRVTSAYAEPSLGLGSDGKEGTSVRDPTQLQTARFGPIAMEQSWNSGGATGCKPSARQRPENGLTWRQTIATGCHPLPFGSHGKEGVDGSSPSEGFTKALQIGI